MLELPNLGTYFTTFCFFSKSICDAQKWNRFLFDKDGYDIGGAQAFTAHISRSEARRRINHFHLFPVNENIL